MSRAISPIPVIVAAVLIVAGVVYFMFLKPSAEEAKVARDWATPEAAAARGPGKVQSQGYQDTVRQLREKENAKTVTRRRERE